MAPPTMRATDCARPAKCSTGGPEEQRHTDRCDKGGDIHGVIGQLRKHSCVNPVPNEKRRARFVKLKHGPRVEWQLPLHLDRRN